MYKIIYTMAFLMICLSTYLFSQFPDNRINNVQAPQYIQKTYHVKDIQSEPVHRDNKNEGTQVLTYRTIVYNKGQADFCAYSLTTPMAYDPASGMIFITSTDYMYANNAIDKMVGKVYYSRNMGNSWDTLKVFDEGSGVGIMNVSIAINNENAVTSINELPFTVIGSLMNPATGGGWNNAGLVYSYKKGTEYIASVDEYPYGNNDGSYVWAPMKFKSLHNSPYAFGGGLCYVSANSTRQAGSYGCFVTNMNEPNENYYQSTMPDEWKYDKFSIPTEGLGYRSTSDMEVAVDDDGNFYAAVCNIFAEDLENRVPGVSKSADNGDTWEPFNPVPADLIEQYRLREDAQYPHINVYNPYNSTTGLIALGNDTYNYYFTLSFSSEDGSSDTTRRIDLVEAKYVSGDWTLSKVYELQGSAPYVFKFSQKYNALNRYDVVRLDFSDLGYEIQASKTADGQYIVVKFIDQASVKEFATPILMTFDHDNSSTTPEQDIQFGSIGVMDCYIASRRVNESNWLVKNVTADSSSQKATWIPDIVPSITQIPFFWARTGVFSDPPYTGFNTLPVAIRDRFVSIGYAIDYATITNALEVDVEEIQNYNFKVFAVSPNPVTDKAEFTFELNEPANVRIEITNALGQSVKVVYDNYTGEGLHGINANLSDISSGVYYYTLTAGNNKETKVMNIIK